jgi:hypothetical protein
VAVLLLALLASRTCGSSQPEISKDEAIEIARGEVAYEPDGVQVRNVGQGVPETRRIWAVSLYTGSATAPERLTIVEVDAETGEVRRVRGSTS